LQLAQSEVAIFGARPVICAKTARAALKSIIEQGEGAPEHSKGSHFQKFIEIRTEYQALLAAKPDFAPAFPAAINPVLRRPIYPNGRVWIEDEEAAQLVDLANASYALMLRLIAHAYVIARPLPQKSLCVDLALGLMRASTLLAERAARRPAGPSNPGCNAGMSFTALRDAAPFVAGPAAGRFFTERLSELADAALRLPSDPEGRTASATRYLTDLSRRCLRGFGADAAQVAPAAPARDTQKTAPGAPPVPVIEDGIEVIEGEKIAILYDGPKCIHARFCVTGAPKVFLANVQGPWINPDAMDVELLAGIAHACPSGAIRYRRKDGRPEEPTPPVNLIAIREGGPYAVHADIQLDGEPAHFRATLCRCGGSKRKPFCDGTHHEINFSATGEPPTGAADMLPVRDGPLAIDPQMDGPLQVRGNLEITSGTGRVVARVTNARLCRCGGSANKPFCDNTHARIGFRSS
jgi:CDGSH-type Zn-finger protein/uncharacterized Fe-S cluster protein YjdI